MKKTLISHTYSSMNGRPDYWDLGFVRRAIPVFEYKGERRRSVEKDSKLKNVLLSAMDSIIDSTAVAMIASSVCTPNVSKAGRIFSFGYGVGMKAWNGIFVRDMQDQLSSEKEQKLKEIEEEEFLDPYLVRYEKPDDMYEAIREHDHVRELTRFIEKLWETEMRGSKVRMSGLDVIQCDYARIHLVAKKRARGYELTFIVPLTNFQPRRLLTVIQEFKKDASILSDKRKLDAYDWLDTTDGITDEEFDDLRDKLLAGETEPSTDSIEVANTRLQNSFQMCIDALKGSGVSVENETIEKAQKLMDDLRATLAKKAQSSEGVNLGAKAAGIAVAKAEFDEAIDEMMTSMGVQSATMKPKGEVSESAEGETAPKPDEEEPEW